VLSHARIWAAIDQLAARHDLSASALAKRAGLDPTTFNPSKRKAVDGRQRWPSTESIAKVLDATGTDVAAFFGYVAAPAGEREGPFRRVPLLGLAQAGAGGFFDDGGFPVGQGWEEVTLPNGHDDGAYALEVTGDSMMPLYRDGDIIIVSPNAPVRPGDRVVVKTRAGEVMAKVLQRKGPRGIELLSLNPDHPSRSLQADEVDWVARITWASQ
jgi:phage repressor protein C with HTH and peptisase S24 domain